MNPSQSDISQIKIGQHTYGIVGLKQALEALSETHAKQPDAAVAEELLRRLSKENYIPGKAQEKYGGAFVREFRKYLGQAFAEEKSELPEIKVLGAGCSVCDGLENQIMEALAETGLAADLEHIRDPDRIAEFKVKTTPALIINGKVMGSGAVPSKGQIQNWLEEFGHNRQAGGLMDKKVFIKNILFSEARRLVDLVDYEKGRVVSRTFAQNPSLSLTLFAFDKGEGVSTHTAPGDALLQVLDGDALVNIDGKEMTVAAGEVVVMPANIPHSVNAVERFKMLLTVVK
jgi:quercetin dioxygenase-like cupin family protein